MNEDLVTRKANRSGPSGSAAFVHIQLHQPWAPLQYPQGFSDSVSRCPSPLKRLEESGDKTLAPHPTESAMIQHTCFNKELQTSALEHQSSTEFIQHRKSFNTRRSNETGPYPTSFSTYSPTNGKNPLEFVEKPQLSDCETSREGSHAVILSGSQEYVSKALQQCRSGFSGPFDYLRMFIGWKPMGYVSVDSPPRCKRFGNSVVLLLLLATLLFSYGCQFFYCQYQMNYLPSHMMAIRPVRLNDTQKIHRNISSEEPDSQYSPPACSHIISTYLIPNSLHFVAYLIGLFHFRVHANEDLDALMEKVFQSTSTFCQQRWRKGLVIRMYFYLIGAALWIGSTFVTHLLYYLANIFQMQSATPAVTSQDWNQFIMFVIDMFGYVIVNIISITILLNYIVTCDLIIVYTKSVCEKLTMRLVDIVVARKEILMITSTVNHLNGATGLMASCILAVHLEMIIMGFIILSSSESTDLWTTTYHYLFAFHLLPTLIYTLIKALRVASQCHQLKTLAIHMRTYGYPNTSIQQLDSYLLFVMAIKFRIKIFSVPVKSSYLFAFFVIVLLGLTTLVMTGVYTIPVLSSTL